MYTHAMSKRLQILVEDGEFDEIHRAASEEGLTMSEWVRNVLRRARRSRSGKDVARKLDALRAAARHEYPTADIDVMLEEIARGYEQP